MENDSQKVFWSFVFAFGLLLICVGLGFVFGWIGTIIGLGVFLCIFALSSSKL